MPGHLGALLFFLWRMASRSAPGQEDWNRDCGIWERSGFLAFLFYIRG